MIVLHGAGDVIVPPAHARRTAAIVPHAELRILDELGHFSIVDEVIPAITSSTT